MSIAISYYLEGEIVRVTVGSAEPTRNPFFREGVFSFYNSSAFSNLVKFIQIYIDWGHRKWGQKKSKITKFGYRKPFDPGVV